MVQKPQSVRLLSKVIASFAVFVIIGSIFVTNRWQFYDWWRMRGRTVSEDIRQLSLNSSMSATASKIFYSAYPDIITEKGIFSEKCRGDEQTIVLGCFVDGHKIYIYHINDDRLSGAEVVTAAHEMLHAAYQRLSPAQRTQINKLIDNEYSKVTDQRIIDVINNYKKNGANIQNELHSILPTEVKTLSPELEEYFAKYFTNRNTVFEASQKYKNEFTKRQEMVELLDIKLNDALTIINKKQQELDLELSGIYNDRDYLDDLLRQGSVAKYNSGVSEFNARIDSYNSAADGLQILINEYNEMIAQRNELSVEQNALLDSIDTRVQPL